MQYIDTSDFNDYDLLWKTTTVEIETIFKLKLAQFTVAKESSHTNTIPSPRSHSTIKKKVCRRWLNNNR